MVTRKAVQAAFELIVNEPEVVDVLYFCFRDGTPVERVCRVSVTRDMEFPNNYTVKLGLCSKGEREWFAEKTAEDGYSPKFHIRTWMYGKEKRALARRLKSKPKQLA